MSLPDRFWAKVDKDGPEPERSELGECWVWTATRLRGYGRFGEGYAHRASYTAYVGPIPDGFQVDHLCSNPSCVRPTHLEAVTPRVNALRSTSFAAQHARQTHCKRGHEFSPENTYLTKRRQRYCRRCHALKERERKARIRADLDCQHRGPSPLPLESNGQTDRRQP